MRIDPKKDGVDHINIYSRGATKLGRMLSNFYRSATEIDGVVFNSIEAYWYYIGINWPEPEEVVVRSNLVDIPGKQYVDKAESDKVKLASMYGFNAKKFGRRMRAKYGYTEGYNFIHIVEQALRKKVKQNKELMHELKKSTLRFEHYFIRDGRPRPGGSPWIVEAWEEIRQELETEEASEWLEAHQDLFSAIPDRRLPDSKFVAGRTDDDGILF